MSTTRAALRHAIDSHLRLVHASATVTGTATGGTTSTVVDTARTEADDYWNNCWLYVSSTTDGKAPQDEESLVADFVAATDTLTLNSPLSVAVGAGDTYELRRFFSAGTIHSAINLALEDAQYQLRQEEEDSTLVIEEDIYDYTLPSTVEHVLKLEYLEHTIEYRGQATDGDTTTLEDSSRSWTANALADMEIALYKGTGAGQYRTIASNTADTITVSVAWETNPDSTSYYVVKDLTQPYQRYRVLHANMVGSSLHLREALPPGQRLCVTHVPAFAPLATDAATTSVPQTYVVLRAAQHLMLMAPAILPEAMQDQAHRIHDRLELQVGRYLAMNKRTEVHGTWWNRGGATRHHWYSAGRGIGTKKEL